MSVGRLDRAGGGPLWKQLQEDLVRRLRSGEFDDAFPGELALVDEYAVSRHTVRQALGQLRTDGLIIAERGRQPRVATVPEIRQPMGALYSLFSSVEASGLPQRSAVRALDVRADGVIAARLNLDGSTPLLYLERLRYAGDEPLALDRVWLPATLAEPLLDADFTHTSLYNELSTRAGVNLDHGREDIRAVNPSPSERALLHCPADAAAFSIVRQGTAQNRPVEWRHTLVRGDRFALSAEFSANAGYRLTPSTTALSQAW
ncbi:GntR family transcriptional regulator [Kribbella jiaozuonensis]|uniref:GntR family transcriptional regulator n=1 Tax=Kribbella jiaozuonensis TaxID=2575441 RepID=A0A4U3M345_9ACTN|nr:GntR family transcriptional regulator [Kribbella jiaozuonensis]TKK81697.1 GntR family transcriptional regulator [Kribbella jiaozuonensis]